MTSDSLPLEVYFRLARTQVEPRPRNMLPHDKERNREALLLFALILLTVAVRLPGIGASFYGDEGFSLLRDSNQLLTTTEDRFRPLYFSLLYLWRSLGFHGEFGLRGLSLLFGVLQIPVGYLLAKRLAGPRAGFVFGLLLALDPMLIEFSQELRMYSLVPLVALMQAWAFAAVAARSAERKPVLGAWLGFVLAGAVGVYSHFHYWFLLAGFGFAVLRRRRELDLKQGLSALFAIVVLYLPNVSNVLRFQREAGGAPHLLATDLASALPKLIVACSVGFNYFSLPDLGMDRAVRLSSLAPNIALTICVAIPALLVGWQLVRLIRTRQPGPVFWLAVELFVVPAAVSFLAVVVTHKNFVHPKYMVFSAPFLPLLLCAGYLATRERAARLALAATSIFVFAVAIVHFNQPERYGRRENWRGAAEYLRPALGSNALLLRLGNVGTGESVTLSNGTPRSLWEYYAADLFGRTKTVSLPTADAGPQALVPVIERVTRDKRDIYYLWSEIGRNFDDPNDALLAAARSVLIDEDKRQFNPRFILFHWHTR